MKVIIDGVQIKSPHAIKVGIFRLSKSGRLASGLMTMDIIAKKRRIDLSWEVISGTAINQIIDLLDAKTFYTVQYEDPKYPLDLLSITAYVGDINLEQFRSDGMRVWKNISFPLIER